MIRIVIDHPDGTTKYVPAPCRGVVSGVKVAFQTNTVEVGDTVVVAKNATAVNTVTAAVTAGLVTEKGVPDVTNKGLVFDPDSATAIDTVMVVTDTGAPGDKIVIIEFDDFAFVNQAASEA